MLTLKACSSGWTPARDAYNGLANSRFHTLLFGINRLRSDELLHCRAMSPCSGAFVQLLCNQNFNCLPCRWTPITPITTVNDGESYGSRVRRLGQTGHLRGVRDVAARAADASREAGRIGCSMT